MIRKFITSVVCAILFFAGFSQENIGPVVPDPMLYEVYTQEYLDRLSTENPPLIQFLNFKLKHSYEVMDLSGKSDINAISTLSNVSLKSKIAENQNSNALNDYEQSHLNVLKYNFQTEKNGKTAYQIDGSNDYLVFYSENKLLEMFKQSLTND